MKKTTAKEEVLKTPADIWKKLIERGNIQVSYDQELIDSLKNRFGVKAPEDLLAYLKRSTITNEEFLLAFFQELSPYAVMYKELLLMFEKANARCTDRNLKIDFNFGVGNEFDFSIEEFRQFTEEMQKVLKMTDPERMSFLRNIVPNNILGYDDFANDQQSWDLIDESARAWLKEYDSDNWMRTDLAPPIFDFDDTFGNRKITDYLDVLEKVYPAM